MSRSLTFLLLLISSNLFADESLTLISYNIRQDTPSDKGPRDWQQRKNKLTDYLVKSEASIIGLQEVRHKQLLDVDKALPNHSFVGVGRVDGKTAGEYSPLFYDRKVWKLDPDHHGTFWLSDTPTVPNSRTWGNRNTRICSWARLTGVQGVAKGRSIYVFNTHWDHISQRARLSSARLMFDTIKSRAHKKDPVVLMGDLNATTDNPAVKHLLGSGLLIDHTTKQVKTFSSWDSEHVAGLRIDHIFTSPAFKNATCVVESNPGVKGHAASDHHPVVLRTRFATPEKEPKQP